MDEVVWSEKPQSCKDVMANHPAPLLVRVEQGYCSEEDGDSLGQGQIIRIQKWLTQQRVIAKDSQGRHFSFSVQFPVPFEVSSEKKRTLRKKRVKSLEEIIRDNTLPVTVVMKSSTARPSDYAIAAAFSGEPLELIQTHDDVYLHGNAVNYGSIDPTVINIPIHASLELKVGQGLENGDQDEWNQLLKDIDDIIAKESRYEPSREHQKILVFMPARNGDDGDELLVADVPRSVSSIDDDDGPDDITKAFGSDEIDIDPDRYSTGGSASGYSIGSGDMLDNDSGLADSNQGNDVDQSFPGNVGEFTSYTQRTSFLLEHGGMAPPNGKPTLDLDGFFTSRNEQNKHAEGEYHPGEKSIFKSNVSKLSFLRPESWAQSATAEETQEEPRLEQTENEPESTADVKTYTKFKNLTINARRMRNKMTSKKSDTSSKNSSKKNQPKDLSPKKRLRKLSLLPDDIYSLTSQQVLDLLKLLELSDFAPMFAFDRIDGRVLSKMTSDELVTKYGMDEDQASKLLAQVNRKDPLKEDDRSLTSYQTTNGALDADYTQNRSSREITHTNRYF